MNIHAKTNLAASNNRDGQEPTARASSAKGQPRARANGETFEGKRTASRNAAGLLRALAHPCRLQVLCALAEKEYCVGDLRRKAGLSQSALSQHLARLRQAGIVSTRRDSQTIYYRIHRPEALEVVDVLTRVFCAASPLKGDRRHDP